MRRAIVVGLTACGFHPTAGTAPDAPPGAVDTGSDARTDVALCERDPDAVLCFSFDHAPEPSVMANEASAAASATVTNVGAEMHGDGYAGLFDPTSEVFVAAAPEVTHVAAVEVWFRLDGLPDDGERMGLYDSNVGPDNLSLFVNRENQGYTLRCGLGGETTTWAAALARDTWYYAACLCTGPNQQMWLDGVLIGDTPGPCTNGGTIVGDGLTIGANNNGGPNGVDAQLVGAIDAIRFTTVAPTKAQLCERAGLPSCE